MGGNNYKLRYSCYTIYTMNSTSIERLLVRAILVLSGAVLCVPLFIFSQSYFPFIVAKAALMRVLIELIVLLYAGLWLNNRNKWQPRFSWVGAVVLFYIFIMTISSIFGASPVRSFWSNWERMSGVFTFVHYGLWFFVLTAVIKEVKHWKALAWTTLAVSLLMSLYAWLQYFNINWSFVFMGGSSRLSGTLGNAAYFGSYMTMHAFIAALLVFTLKGWYRWALSGYVAYLIFMVMLSGTRGAFLGLVASGGVLLLLILFLKLWHNKIYRWLGVIGVSLVLLASLVVAFRDSNLLKDNYLVERFANISMEDNTAQTRLRSWSYGLQGFTDNWLLGYGPENFHVPFNKYFKADFYDYTGNEIWFDYAHSMIVETAATMGIGGFLGYVGLYLAVIFVAIKYRKNTDNPNQLHLSVVMVMAMTAIFVQNAFVFDSFNTYIIFFLIVAWGASWQVQATELKNIWPKKLAIFMGTIFIIFSLYGFVANGKAMTASDWVFKGYSLMSQEKYDEAMVFFDKSRTVTNNLADPMILYSQTLVDKISSLKTQEEAQKLDQQFVNAEPLMNEAMKSDPQSVSLRLTLARFYMSWGQLTRNPSYLEKAEENVKITIEFSPERLHAFWTLAQIKLMQAKYGEANEILDRAIKINPKQGQSYWLKFYVASYENNKEEAIKNAWLAMANGFEVPSLTLIEEAIVYAQNNGFNLSSFELQSAIKQAINLGTSKKEILEMAKQIPTE